MKRPLIQKHFPDIDKLSEIMPVYKANPQLFSYTKACDEFIDHQEALIETMFELIQDFMSQTMPAERDGRIDHMCISTFEFAQRFMIGQGKMDESQFSRK